MSVNTSDEVLSAPVEKRPRVDVETNDNAQNCFDKSYFSPQNTQLISILGNDSHSKSIFLHVRFGTENVKDGILILSKSSFPNDPLDLKSKKVVNCILPNGNIEIPVNGDKNDVSQVFLNWEASSVTENDIYRRFLVKSGLEYVNDINMTVIYPAEKHHLKKYSFSGRHLIQETPEMYRDIIVPFLSLSPKDLTWVDNIITGKSELDRTIYSNQDPDHGFTLVLDYKWDGSKLNELHCLGIVHNRNLTCLRDLQSSHIPMLKEILEVGRSKLVSKYTPNLNEDEIVAYFHYPPSFYWLHVHFSHVNAIGTLGTCTVRAHMLDEVIRNLEISDSFYSNRTLTIYLHDNSPMRAAIHQKLHENDVTN